ncbi:MAG: DUF169 domain-containing protein [Alistipes sp.]
MEQLLRDRFTTLWRRYFNHAELPLTFEYVDDTRCEQPEPAFAGHRCLIGQLIKARNGRTLCLTPESISCRGAGRYLSFREGMFPGFAEFIAHNAAGNGERYRQTPEMVTEWINSLAVLPIRGGKLIVKRWDQLCAEDQPEGVIFFAEPDVLSGLFTSGNGTRHHRDVRPLSTQLREEQPVVVCCSLHQICEDDRSHGREFPLHAQLGDHPATHKISKLARSCRTKSEEFSRQKAVNDGDDVGENFRGCGPDLANLDEEFDTSIGQHNRSHHREGITH